MLKQLQDLRTVMQERNIDAVYIPTADFHESEYVHDYFQGRRFLSGFTGSAGVLLVMREEAKLWTDGRYFIQAAQQLGGSGIDLCRSGEEGVLSVSDYIAKHMPVNGTLCFDGRVVNAAFAKTMQEAGQEKNITFVNADLVHEVWKDCPALPSQPIFVLDMPFCGKERQEKLADVHSIMRQLNATHHILTGLDDIAWLLNIRGNDIPCNPVSLSYVMLTPDEVYLYIDENKVSEEIQAALGQSNIFIKPYNTIYQDVSALPADACVLLDKRKVNDAIVSAITGTFIDQMNPTTKAKAQKNAVEIENLRRSHIKDGVAVTKFMYWLKYTVKKEAITERSAAAKLLALRQEQLGFIEPSFHTIAAYEANAAMMHYAPTPQSDAKLSPKGMLLVDSGGQYMEGTTDITRTFVLGDITAVQKEHFTAVVRSMLALSNAKFLYGTIGMSLDMLARQVIWQYELDYQCGTGHGVGYLLNVHEGPHGLRWYATAAGNESVVFEEGMVVTDEPGIYLPNQYGIRIENELVVCKGTKNTYGQFMHFEVITYAPIDIEGIDPALMSAQEKTQLNQYHAMVYDTLHQHLNKEEAAWLKEVTKAI